MRFPCWKRHQAIIKHTPRSDAVRVLGVRAAVGLELSKRARNAGRRNFAFARLVRSNICRLRVSRCRLIFGDRRGRARVRVSPIARALLLKLFVTTRSRLRIFLQVEVVGVARPAALRLELVKHFWVAFLWTVRKKGQGTQSFGLSLTNTRRDAKRVNVYEQLVSLGT